MKNDPSGQSLILVIDTAMASCGTALFDSESGLGSSLSAPMPRGQSEHLVPQVQDVIRQAGKEFSDIGRIVVTVGPGAFTGLRIGLSAARAFGLTIGCPVHGVLTTASLADTVFAAGAVEGGEDLMILLDTKRGDFYAQIFGADGAAIADPSVVAKDDLPHLAAGRSLAVAGDAAGAMAGMGRVLTDHVFIDPLSVARAAAARVKAGHAFLPPEPVYLRGAEVSVSKKVTRILSDD